MISGQVTCTFDSGDGTREKGNIITAIWWYEQKCCKDWQYIDVTVGHGVWFDGSRHAETKELVLEKLVISIRPR